MVRLLDSGAPLYCPFESSASESQSCVCFLHVRPLTLSASTCIFLLYPGVLSPHTVVVVIVVDDVVVGKEEAGRRRSLFTSALAKR